MIDYKIAKKQNIESNFKKRYYFIDSARTGLTEILRQDELRNKKILLPAYIGYSSNEGSGIFDPIIKTKIDYKFYRFNHKLEIKTQELIDEIDNSEPGIILFVHYFGFRDKNLDQLKEYAKSKNFIVIEDCAHAYFTFYNKPIFDSDYIVFSLHKMFPFKDGGILYSKEKLFSLSNKDVYDLSSYDISGIIEKRKENYFYLLENIKKLKKYNLIILRSNLRDNVPQTFPILLESKEIRDYLYFELNKKGIGVVSLYHQLIAEISYYYKVEHSLSDKILNLPVHQDVSIKELNYLISNMESLLDKRYHRKK